MALLTHDRDGWADKPDRPKGKRPAPVVLSRVIRTTFGDFELPPGQKGLTQEQHDAIQAECKRQADDKGARARARAARLQQALDAAFIEVGFISPAEAPKPEVRPNDLSTQPHKEAPNG